MAIISSFILTRAVESVHKWSRKKSPIFQYLMVCVDLSLQLYYKKC